MPNAAIVAAALTDHSAHPWSILLAGVDVVKQPGAAGNGYGVPIHSVRIDRAIPGEVSAATFVIQDPLGVIAIPTGGDTVQIVDNTNNRPVFTGYVSAPSTRDYGVGREIEVYAVGAEIILDWSILPADLTFAALTAPMDAIWTLLGSVLWGAPGVRALGYGGTFWGTQALPIADLSGALAYAVTVTAGTTLRAAIAQVTEAWRALINSNGTWDAAVTIDEWMGLRIYATISDAVTSLPADYVTLTVTDAPGSALVADTPEDTIDGGAELVAVLVKGGSAAGTGTVGGTGRPGRIGFVSAPGITTADDRDATGRASMVQTQNVHRGGFDLVDFTPPGYVPAGGATTFTDSRVGTSGSYRIGGITVSIESSNRQTWSVTYGAAPASAIELSSLL